MGLELVSVISSYLKHEKPSVCLTSALIEDAKVELYYMLAIMMIDLNQFILIV